MTLELQNLLLPLATICLEVNITLTASITGLTGPSGSGKTSLLEIIAGLRRPAAGVVRFNGSTFTDAAGRIFVPPWERRIGYVPQDLALFPHLNLEENLLYASRATGTPVNQSLKAKVLAMLELKPLIHRSVETLSGGEKCRAALGRALMSRPALLLLDEPLAQLDDRLRFRALDYLLATAGEFDLPILFVSHSASEISRICSKVIHMEQGRLTGETGP